MDHHTNTPATAFRFKSALFTVLSPPRPTLRSAVSVAGSGGEAEWHSPATTASTVTSPVGRTEGPSAGDIERFRNAYSMDPIAELSAPRSGRPSRPRPASHLADSVRDPFARVPSPPWMEEGRASKKRKITTDIAVVTQKVAQPWAGREEGAKASVLVSSPGRNPFREVGMPRHVDASTTRQQGRDNPSVHGLGQKGVRLNGKATDGTQMLSGARVASDEAHPKSVARKKTGQKRSKPKKNTRGALDTTEKGSVVKPACGETAQCLRPVDDKSGSPSSGEEEVD